MEFREITTLKDFNAACAYYGRYNKVLDKEGNPVLDEDGNQVLKPKILSVDTETGNVETTEGVLEPFEGDLSLIQISDDVKTVIVDVFALYEEAGIPKIRENGVLMYDYKKGYYLFKELKKIFENPEIKLVIHNSKFECKWFIAKCDIYPNGIFDSFIAAVLIDYNPSKDPRKMHNLGAVMRFYVGQDLDKAEQKSNWGARPLTAEQKEYAALDVYFGVPLREAMLEYLIQKKLLTVAKLEFDAVLTVAAMELRGVKVNRDLYSKEIEVITVFRDKAKKLLQEKVRKDEGMVQTSLFGLPEKDYGEVLLTSSAQMKEALNKFDIPVFSKKEIESFELYLADEKFINSLGVNDRLTIMKEKYPKFNFELYQNYKQALKDGKKIIQGTGAKAMLSMDKSEYEVLGSLDEFRSSEIMLTTFGYPLLNKLRYHGDGHERLHPNFKQIGAPTGRFSCTKPNVQQIPAGNITVDGEKHTIMFREAFDFPVGYKGINADYSQIELRIAASQSGDRNMLDTFKSGRDLHADTASRVFGVEYELCAQDGHEYYKTYRKYSKSINFGIIYGMGADALSAQIGVTKEEAQEMIDKYANAYPVLWNYLKTQYKKAVKTLQARTASGRLQEFMPAKLDEMGEPLRHEIAAIGRNGMNMPIQGTSADILKRSLKLLFDALRPYDAHIVNIVHDEITVEAKDDENIETVRKLVEDCMIKAAYEFVSGVPIAVDAKIVRNWSDK